MRGVPWAWGDLKKSIIIETAIQILHKIWVNKI
jgi:hypothetical protein